MHFKGACEELKQHVFDASVSHTSHELFTKTIKQLLNTSGTSTQGWGTSHRSSGNGLAYTHHSNSRGPDTHHGTQDVEDGLEGILQEAGRPRERHVKGLCPHPRVVLAHHS